MRVQAQEATHRLRRPPLSCQEEATVNSISCAALTQLRLRVADIQHCWCLPPEHIMYWLAGSLIGVAIALAWVYVELALARREPLI